MAAILTVRGACKRFGATEALAGADLELRQGEWLGLLGPNGAGKTTLVRSIAGRVRLDAGELHLQGVTLDGSAAAEQARRSLGVVPQTIALYPLLTASENLRAFGALNGLAGQDLQERVAWGLDWTGLGDRAREPVKRFSGGMQRRLNLACGVLHRPQVLLLDEPTVGVDPQSRERIWEMLTQLHAEGTSLLLTTHQLDEAQRVSERIAILDGGQTIACGTFSELLAATVGAERRVTVHLDDRSTVAHSLSDLAGELPALINELGPRGIHDLRVEVPTLQDVFLHLTGRELRE